MEGRVTAASFNRLSDFEQCAYKLFLKVVQKAEEASSEKGEEARNRGIQVHDDLEKYIRGERDEPTDDKKAAKHIHVFGLDKYRELYAERPDMVLMEEEWAYRSDWSVCGWWDEDVWLRVKVDRFVWLDDEKSAADVVDYKTGKKEGNEVKHAQQMQLYAAAAFMRFPDLQAVNVILEYLDHGKTTKRSYSREEAMFFVTQFDKRLKALTEATRFAPKPNRVNCRYCPFGPTNGSGVCEYGVEA